MTPPDLLTSLAHAVAPSSSSMPSWENGPEVAAISQTVMAADSSRKQNGVRFSST
jgi:hypothetical protein